MRADNVVSPIEWHGTRERAENMAMSFVRGNRRMCGLESVSLPNRKKKTASRPLLCTGSFHDTTDTPAAEKPLYFP